MNRSDQELLKKLTNDQEYSLYFTFFTGKLHFVPEIIRKKNKKILAFKPYPVTYENGSISSWTTFDTRYERDMWSSDGDIRIEFDCVQIIPPHNPIVLSRRKNVVAELRERVFASARIEVISRSDHDRHSYGVLHLQSTNSYTYAEFKDNKYISGIRKFSYNDLGDIKPGSVLKYFVDHERPVMEELKGE